MKKNKIISLLLSVVIALCLWIYVVTVVTPEDAQWVYNIPVTFTNENGLFADRNLTLTGGRNQTVNLKFRGNRQDLQKLTSSNVIVTANLSQIDGPGDWQISYEYELPDTVSANDISLEDRNRTTVSVIVDMLETKEIPVQAVFQGDVAEGYMPEAIELEEDTLWISGPQDVVATVDHAQVVLERTNVSKTVSDSLSYTFMDPEGNPVESDEIQCDVDKVAVMMVVNMVKEVPLTVEYIEGGGATAENVIEEIEPSTVTIKGNAEALEGLNSLSIARIDLTSIQNTYTTTANIIIPDGMTIMSADTATVSIELRGLTEKTFRVTNLEMINAPESEELLATIGTTSMQVKLRGPSEVMDAISSNNIRAVADLSFLSSSTGMFSVPVTIYVEGFSDVGAMGSYSVMVSISKRVQVAETMTTVGPTPATAEGDAAPEAAPDETEEPKR